MKPLQANSAETLVNRIKWAASVPMKAASAPVGASTDSVQNLAQGVASENENGGELVW
jgi:L-arabinose isomerase